MKLYRASNKIDVIFAAEDDDPLKADAITYFLEIIKNASYSKSNELEDYFEVKEIKSEKDVPDDWKDQPIWGLEGDEEATPSEFLNQK